MRPDSPSLDGLHGLILCSRAFIKSFMLHLEDVNFSIGIILWYDDKANNNV